MRRFPTARWDKKLLEFTPAPARPPFRPFASMIFLWMGDEVVLCNIPERGWCIPSGRVEPDEDPKAAALREAYEEAGVRTKGACYLGCYRITGAKTERWAEVYVAEVAELVEIPEWSESSDRRLVKEEELPAVYHAWNRLFAELFRYSKEVLCR